MSTISGDMVTARRAWSRDLRRRARESTVLKSEFFQRLATSPENEAKRLLRLWADQDYWVSMRFPCLLGILIGQVKNPRARHLLVKNLWEEHGDGDGDATHFALFARLRSGIVDDPGQEPVMASGTGRYIDRQERIAKEDVFAGLGAFCYANEYITLLEFEPLEVAAAKWFIAADKTFFKANRDVDPRHATETEDVIEMLARTSDEIERVRYGTLEALDARTEFYDCLLAQADLP